MIITHNMPIDLVINTIGSWSDETFGSHLRGKGLIKHMLEEIDEEILPNPTDQEEVADLVVIMSNIVHQNVVRNPVYPFSLALKRTPVTDRQYQRCLISSLGLDDLVWEFGRNIPDKERRKEKYTGLTHVRNMRMILAYIDESGKTWDTKQFTPFFYSLCLLAHSNIVTYGKSLLSDELNRKMQKNVKRKWQPPDEDGIVRHVPGSHD